MLDSSLVSELLVLVDWFHYIGDLEVSVRCVAMSIPPLLAPSGVSASASDVSALSAVNLKLPPSGPQILSYGSHKLRRNSPAIKRSKLDHVVASLLPDGTAEMRDLLLKPPWDKTYAALKEQLIKRTTVSERQRLLQLVTGEELGDRKPTQLLRRMQ